MKNLEYFYKKIKKYNYLFFWKEIYFLPLLSKRSLSNIITILISLAFFAFFILDNRKFLTFIPILILFAQLMLMDYLINKKHNCLIAKYGDINFFFQNKFTNLCLVRVVNDLKNEGKMNKKFFQEIEGTLNPLLSSKDNFFIPISSHPAIWGVIPIITFLIGHFKGEKQIFFSFILLIPVVFIILRLLNISQDLPNYRILQRIEMFKNIIKNNLLV